MWLMERLELISPPDNIEKYTPNCFVRRKILGRNILKQAVLSFYPAGVIISHTRQAWKTAERLLVNTNHPFYFPPWDDPLDSKIT